MFKNFEGVAISSHCDRIKWILEVQVGSLEVSVSEREVKEAI